MIERRKFIKKATIGTVSLTSLGGLANIEQAFSNEVPENDDGRIGKEGGKASQHGSWEIDFNPESTRLTLRNQYTVISGKLSFTSDGTEWSVGSARDGAVNRNTLIDPYGNVQGYWTLNQSGTRLELLFYHRTAQRFKGRFSFEGAIAFHADAFPCRTNPMAGENVLQLACGRADSLLNDSLFSPGNDALLRLTASDTTLKHDENGTFAFQLSGNIEQAPEATFTFILEEHYFQNRYVPYYSPINRDRCPVAPTGWMSWNTYFDTATAEDNLSEARIGKKYLQPFGCEFWSIESWQGNSDKLPVSGFHNMNLEVNEKQFPKGMKNLADEIRKLGFRPGLWMAPFGTGNHSFYEKHKHWFLHKKDGTPVSSWNGKYTLDPTVKEAREHLKEIHRIASKEWGYEFFKIDGMSGRGHGYCAHLYERPEIKELFSDPSCPNPFELCVQAFREGIGEDRVLLACQGHSSGPEARYADASRLGADIVNANQPVKWSGVLNQASCFLNQAFTHNIVMYADPDTLLVRDLPLEEARTSATIVALPGQLTFFGDKLAGLAEEKMKILQQTLPVAQVRPASLYPHFDMLQVWNLSVQNEWLGAYNVVAFFNWEDQPQTVSTTTGELGIPDNEYMGLEFWESKPYNYTPSDGKLSVDVPAHGVRLVTLHLVKDCPQWLGSDRHIAQTGMELSKLEWNGHKKALSGTIELINSFPLSIWIHVPNDYAFNQLTCKDAKYEVTEQGDLLKVTFQSKKTILADFDIIFSER